MPGNEAGDRVHNFFDQGSLSQDQCHTQFATANWPEYNNHIWNANERQIGGPVNNGLENYGPQQSDNERGKGNQLSLGSNGLNFARQNLRPEYFKNSSPRPQVNLNGFMHASQVGHTRHNEANFLGVGTGSDRHNMTFRSPVLESDQRSSQLMNSVNFDGSELPLNFNILNSQQPGMMQSLPRQHPESNNTQWQQQFILKQMELQRQHQLQQFETIQRSAVNHIPSSLNQTAGQHPPSINGNPLRDASNYPWPSQVTASNMNWQQRGLSASVPGYSNGFMISPEQGQAMHFVGWTPQQTSQSLYGAPVSNSRSYTHSNIDKPGMLQVSTPNRSFFGHQYATLAEQASVKEGNNMISKYGSEEKSSFGQASSPRIGHMVDLGGFTPVQHRNIQVSESGVQGFAGGSELITEKSLSEASSQGAVSQTAASQAAIGLDPTEEKILFGSDDNIWEACGGASITGSGDATDLLSGFPSMQNGTWSALMQSAVAETFSIDGDMQEEWSGLGSQNSRPQSGSGSQHPSVPHSKEKPQINSTDSSQRGSRGSRLNSNDINVHNANTDINYVNTLGQHHLFLNQRRDNLQTEGPITQQGIRWLDCQQQKPHAVEKGVVGNSNSSREAFRTAADFWGHQQSTCAQQSSRPSTSNFVASVQANGSIALTNEGNLHDNHAATRLEPVTYANIKLGSSHACSKDDAVAPGLCNMQVDLESSQKLPNNHHHDLCKSINFPGKSGSEGSGVDQHNLNNGSSNLDGGVEMHETENSDRRESSSDSHCGGFPPNVSVGCPSENMRSDPADRCSMPGGKETSTVQAGKRGPLTRKFQYHPMGDVDVNLDSSYAAKQLLHSQSMSQHRSAGTRGQEVNPRFLGPLSTNITDMESQKLNYHGPVDVSCGLPGGTHPGYWPNMSSAFVRSGEISSLNQHLSSSENMLELLHKVDQSKEQNTASCFSKLPDTPVGVAGPNQSHLSTSHGFSLQLAPPSQVIAHPNVSGAVRSSSSTVGSPSTGHVGSVKEDRHTWLASPSSAECLPPHQPTQIDSGTEPVRLGLVDSGVPVPHLKHNSSNSSLKSRPQSEHSAAPGGNLWASQQHLLETQACNAPGFFKSQFQSPNASEPLYSQQKDELDGPKRVDAFNSQGIVGGEDTQPELALCSVKGAGNSLGEPSARDLPDASASCHTIKENVIESLHHPANQNSAAHNYFLMSQMQTMKSLGSDPSHWGLKRLKGQDDVHDPKQIAGQVAEPIAGRLNSSMGQTSVAARDAKMLNFSAQLGNVTSKSEHTGISPQMAPSWFNQYGTFKNGQLLPGHNISRVTMKNVEQQLIGGHKMQLASSATESGHTANSCQTANAYTLIDHISSVHALVPRVSAPSPASLRPKKRKTATSDLLPWNKEIGLCLKKLQNLSSAEVDWAQSSNRLIEKVEDEIDNSEDLLAMPRTRRRLLLTTQLMQQVLHSPSASVLSLDASSEYEVIVYSAARSVLGEACSLICGVESNSPVESANLISGKVKTSRRIRDQYFSKVVEDFVSSEKELENELLRLDKRASILDFRVDCEDLERFSVINRFARFHGRGQVDVAESSSSSDTNATVLKPSPQRYVSAYPMPRNIPERVQCLSL